MTTTALSDRIERLTNGPSSPNTPKPPNAVSNFTTVSISTKDAVSIKAAIRALCDSQGEQIRQGEALSMICEYFLYGKRAKVASAR